MLEVTEGRDINQYLGGKGATAMVQGLCVRDRGDLSSQGMTSIARATLKSPWWENMNGAVGEHGVDRSQPHAIVYFWNIPDTC